MNTLFTVPGIQWGYVQWFAVVLLFVAMLLDVVDYYKAKKENRKRYGFLQLQSA